MTTVYFTNPDNEQRIAKTVADISVQELIDMDIIPEGASYIERVDGDYDNFPPDDFEGHFFECLTFNQTPNPTAVVINLDQAKSQVLEELRMERNTLLDTADHFMLKAIGMKHEELQDIIEKDKQALRDLPETINLGQITDVEGLRHLAPPILDIPYEEKYRNIINEHRKPKKGRAKRPS